MGSIRNNWLEKIMYGLLICICVTSLGCFTDVDSLFAQVTDPEAESSPVLFFEIGSNNSIYGKISSIPGREPQRIKTFQKSSMEDHARPLSITQEFVPSTYFREKRDVDSNSINENNEISAISSDHINSVVTTSLAETTPESTVTQSSQESTIGSETRTTIKTTETDATSTTAVSVTTTAPYCPNISNITVGEMNDGTTEINWTLDPKSEHTSNTYDIKIYSLKGVDCKNHSFFLMDLQTTSYSAVYKLCHCNEYSISVAVHCSNTIQTETINYTYAVVPDPPEGLKIKDVTNRTMTLEWSPPTVVSSPITNYTVYWKRTDTTDYKSTKTNSITNLRLEYLEPYTDYIIKVSAWTCAGEGSPSQEATNKTLEGIPNPPKDLTVLDVTNETLTLTWSPPSAVKGVITNFTVYWKKTDSVGENYESTTTSNASTVKTIEDLAPYTNYTVKVSAWTWAGEGNTSEEVTNRTKEGIPDPPKDLTVLDVTNETLTLTWSPPSAVKGVITNFTVYWKKTDSVGKNYESITTSNASTIKQIENLNPYTNYTVKVSAWTWAGEGNSSEEVTDLTKEGIPDPPEDPTILEVTNKTLTLEWKEPSVMKGVITDYTVYWRKTDSSEKSYKSTNTTGRASKLLLGDLEPYTNYTLKVSAWTRAGEGNSSNEVTNQTTDGIPDPPENLRISESTDETLTLVWSPPGVIKGVITNYTVYCKPSDSTDQHYSPVGTVEDAVLEVQNLNPYTNYTLKVSAWTIAGQGNTSQETTSSTREGKPDPPEDLHIVEITNQTMTLQWSPPKVKKGVITNYTVYLKTAGYTDERHTIDGTPEAPGFVLRDLTPYTLYTLTVSAWTYAGEGKPSPEETRRTSEGTPTAPQNVTVENTSDTSISIRWEKPLLQRGPIDGFYVLWKKTLDEVGNATEIEFSDNYTMCVTNNSEYLIGDLDPWTNYTIEIKAYNKNLKQDILEGPPERIIQATNPAVPEQPNIDIRKVTSGSVSLGWTYAGIFPGPLRYKIEAVVESDPCNAKDAKTIILWERISKPEINWRTKTVVVGSMKPYTSYRIRVCASTDAGDSKSCGSIYQRTNSTAPGKPNDVRADCDYHPTTAIVRWRTPRAQNGLIEEYEIIYGHKDSSSKDRRKERNVESGKCSETLHEFTLTDLHPEINYEISVRAKTHGFSDYGPEEIYHQDCILPAGIPPFPQNDSGPEIKKTNEHEAYFSISRTTFSPEMGAIRSYAIIVGFLPAAELLPRNGNKSEAEEKLPVWSTFWKQNSKFYQATPEEWNPFEENPYDPLDCKPELDAEDPVYCTIGFEKNCSEEDVTNCNGPLIPGKRYGIKLRGFTNGGFSDTSPVIVETASVKKKNVSGIIGGVVFLFLVISVVALAIFVDKKRNFKTYKSIRNFLKKNDVPSAEQNADVELNRIAAYVKEEKSRPMNFATFLDHVKIMMSDSSLKFSQEYEEIKQNSPRHPCTAAEMEENRLKNRWMNIFPFDHSRVKLLPIDDEPSSDYINANYIPGFTSHREYIATQGPLPNTVDDFWRMVWEQGVTMIVMLTQCVERGKKKCEQYWPSDSENTYYGDLKLQLKSESILSTYSIRIFSLQLGSRQHLVKQMHFTKWPDFGSPERPEDLINFVQAVREHLPHTNTGPILVHCSAGVGRTGTFIAVDRLLQHIEYHNDINIYNTVVEMREHRTNMVQTEDQYIYIHKCMTDTISQRLKPRTSLYSTDDLDEDLYSNINPHQATEL